MRLFAAIDRFALRAIMRIAALAERLVGKLAGTISRAAAVTVAVSDRLLTPARATAVVAGAGFAVLAFAQFQDYRGIAIGQAQYEEVAPLTSAPMADTWTPWSTHGPLVAVLGGLALACVFATLTKHWRGKGEIEREGGDRAGKRGFIALGAGASLVALLVILAVNLPRAAEVGEIGDLYAHAEGVLLEGFYMQLAGAGTLLFAALLPISWKSDTTKKEG